MKTKLTLIFICNLLLAICVPAFAQGTAFTYQGQLNDNGQPANGNYDLRFSLFTTNSGGSLAFGFVTNSGVAVSNGLFTLTIDFGSNVFGGTIYWLQIGVRTNGAAGFTAISPRQQLTPAPYSIFAENVSAGGINGTIPTGNVGGTYGNVVNYNNGANSFDGSFYGAFYGSSFVGGNFVGDFIGSGSGLTGVWLTTGNSGTTPGVNFVGTTDNLPLEFHVNSTRALRLEPTANTGYVSGAINVIGGSASNLVMPGIHGATIAGGGAPFYFGGNTENLVAADFGTIGGGVNNEIQSNAYESTISGGNYNSIQPGAFRSTIGGGWYNWIQANAPQSFIGGGFGHRIFGDAVTNGNSVIAGGYVNSILTNADYSAIGGGLFNQIYGDTNDFGTGVIGGGDANTINSNSWNSFIGGGQVNSIGTGSDHSVIVGGRANVAGGIGVFIGGGGTDGTTTQGNQVYGNASTIAGGLGNTIQFGSLYSFIGGGDYNSIQPFATNATIGGGYVNVIQSDANGAFIGGGQFNDILNYSLNATIGGGQENIIQMTNYASVIGGGFGNVIQSSTSPVYVIAANTIGGGVNNVIQTNTLYATIGGGGNNTNDAYYGTIPGGFGNLAAGQFSFAAGYHAQALYNGDFVWADSQNTNFPATATDQVSFRCQGGVRFTSGSGALNQTVAWTPGSGSWSFPSDRNLKDRFETVDDESVLARVARLPIVEWSYKGYAQRHIGAMAQDFHTLFPLNNDDKSLNDADLHGVELAAIQGLNEKLDSRNQRSEDRIQKLEAENAELKQRLDALERILLAQKAKE